MQKHALRIIMVAVTVAILLHGHWPAGSSHVVSAQPPQPPPWPPPFLISIVWPHDTQGNPTSVAQSQLVNISIWPGKQVSCRTDFASPSAGLWLAKNNEPAQILSPLPTWQAVLRTVNGVTFPSLEFSDIPADLASDATAQFRFTTMAGNVWVHAADARTFLPNQVVPTGYASVQPGDHVDLRIQVVWPHDAQGNFAPVDRAPFVNVAVDLFAHGTLNSVPVDFDPYHGFAPSLLVAQGNGPIQPVVGPTADKITYTVGGQTYPRWVFNDVPVQPGQQYNFLAQASTSLGKETSQFTTIWTHAPDARTFLPSPQPPPPCAP